MKHKREELLARWSAAETERERALIEEQLAARVTVPAGHKRPFDFRRRLVAEAVGQTMYAVETRRALLESGAVAEPLWRGIDAGELTLGTAVRLLRTARKRARSAGRPVQSILTEELSASGDVGAARKQNGVVVRVRREVRGLIVRWPASRRISRR